MIKKVIHGLLPIAEVDPEGFVYYFGYGSNMNDLIFKGRRKIKPISSFPGYIKDWQLSFDLYALPVFETAFGNVQPVKGCELHGVIHRISYQDFLQVQKTEGGGGTGKGYYLIQLEALDYQEKPLLIWTLKADEETTIKISIFGMLPSYRYLNIVKVGARQYQLKENYLNYLETLEYQRKNVFTFLFGAIMVVSMFPLFLLFLLCRVFLNKMQWIMGKSFKLFDFIKFATNKIFNLFPAFLADVNRNRNCELKKYIPTQKYVPQQQKNSDSQQKKSD